LTASNQNARILMLLEGLATQYQRGKWLLSRTPVT
jgi:hypothetical protein